MGEARGEQRGPGRRGRLGLSRTLVSQTSGVKVVSICSFDFFLRSTSGVGERPEKPEEHGAADEAGAANIRLAASGGGAAAHDFFAAAGSMRKAEAMSRAQAAVAKERILGAFGWAGVLSFC